MLKQKREHVNPVFAGTLFLTFADIEMSKVVTGLMNKDTGLDMVEFRSQIRSLESSSWYKGAKQESAKLSGTTGTVPPPSGGKWWSGCNRSTHNTVDCYGICKWCGGRGHRAENCRFRKEEEIPTREGVNRCMFILFL